MEALTAQVMPFVSILSFLQSTLVILDFFAGPLIFCGIELY